jgi:hypothetical protein
MMSKVLTSFKGEFLPTLYSGEARRGIDGKFINRNTPLIPLLTSPLYDTGRNSLSRC